MIDIPKYGIKVGPMNEALSAFGNQSPTAVINVTDATPDIAVFSLLLIPHFWYPVNEMSEWGFGPFFFIKRLLDMLVLSGSPRIYVGCSGGVCRSPVLVYAWLVSVLDDYSQANVLMGGFSGGGPHIEEMFFRLQEKKNIPEGIYQFLRVMRDYPRRSLEGCLRELAQPIEFDHVAFLKILRSH